MSMKDDLHILVYEEDGIFVAQCLEFDICTQAPDRASLKERIEALIECEMQLMEESGQQVDPAPERFHTMWSQGNLSYKEVAA